MTQYVIRNPNNPIVRDLYKDIPLKDSQGNIITDTQGRVVCDRYVVQGSVGISEEAVNTKIQNLGLTFVDTTSTQTIGGNKAFSGAVTVPTVATDNNSNHVASTAFVQNVLNTITGSSVDNLVTKNTAQTITAVKTFDTLPQSSITPTDNKDLVNKKYVDDNKVSTDDCVKTSGDQTVTGIKTFNTLPQSSVVPSDNKDLVNKKYVDDAVPTNMVTTDTNQTITGVKDFSSIMINGYLLTIN